MAKSAFTPELFKFAVFPNYEQAIIFLADTLSAKEEWDFSDTKSKNNSILKNYLEFTFRKLQQEKKIHFTADNKHACFNTGLVTENLEDIFAFFEEYKNPKPGFTIPFCFKAFLKKSDNNVLRYFSHSFPDIETSHKTDPCALFFGLVYTTDESHELKFLFRFNFNNFFSITSQIVL